MQILPNGSEQPDEEEEDEEDREKRVQKLHNLDAKNYSLQIPAVLILHQSQLGEIMAVINYLKIYDCKFHWAHGFYA
ncbi:hypothetical protein RUM43_007119 [Polyplax serrata]|uniref:Uncharacterized protein n=1 Tax=Polyplax serrata TaxID=468196 RepID=A0AAN8S5A1_POLSC